MPSNCDKTDITASTLVVDSSFVVFRSSLKQPFLAIVPLTSLLKPIENALYWKLARRINWIKIRVIQLLCKVNVKIKHLSVSSCDIVWWAKNGENRRVFIVSV